MSASPDNRAAPAAAGRHLRRRLDALQWPVIGLLWILALVLGCVGFARYFADLGQPATLSGIFYRALQLFVLESGAMVEPVNWQLEVARFLAPAVAALTAIKAVALVLGEQIQRLRLRFARDHVVVAGLGRKGLLLATSLREAGRRVVVIEQDENNAGLPLCRELGIGTIVGDATDAVWLRQARIDRAGALLAVCGEDSTNAAIAISAANALAASAERSSLTCFVHIVDVQLWKLLRDRELAGGGECRLEFFNVFEIGARAMLRRFPPFGSSASPAPRPVVVGLGRLGESLLVHMARRWRRLDAPERLVVTVVDRAAGERCAALNTRFPRLHDVCELVPLEMDVQAPLFERGDWLLDDTGRCAVTIAYVCLDDETRALSAGLALHRRRRERELPIVVRMARNAGLAAFIGVQPGAYADEYAELHAFGLLEETCRADLLLSGTHETLARANHEIWMEQQRAAGHTPADTPYLVPWHALPQEIRESNRREADHIRAKLEAVGLDLAPLEDWDAESFPFTAGEIEIMARIEHQRWMDERLAAGWRPAPGPRDVARKTSPSLVPWEELPEDVKEYDRVAVRGLPALLAEVDLQLERRVAEAASPNTRTEE